jgi:hypothetical protein
MSTPVSGTATVVATGGTAVTSIPPGPNGGLITNPASAADQGLSAAEPLYCDSVGNATLQGNHTTFALAPGQTYAIIPGQTTPTTVNAPSSGHKFSVIYW